MKFIKVLTGLILTIIVLTPVAVGAKEYNMIYGGNIKGGLYVSGTGSYTSAYSIAESANPNIDKISTIIETTNSNVKTAKISSGITKAELYVVGGANSVYDSKVITSETVIEDNDF